MVVTGSNTSSTLVGCRLVVWWVACCVRFNTVSRTGSSSPGSTIRGSGRGMGLVERTSRCSKGRGIVVFSMGHKSLIGRGGNTALMAVKVVGSSNLSSTLMLCWLPGREVRGRVPCYESRVRIGEYPVAVIGFPEGCRASSTLV